MTATKITAALAFAIVLAGFGLLAQAQEAIAGEQLEPSAFGRSYVESMQAAVDRDRLMPIPENNRARNGRHGEWVVPSRGATTFPHSGSHNVINKWGDTHMGIGFPQLVDVQGAYFAGQAGPGVWTTGIVVISYRDGREVQRTEPFRGIGSEPAWLAMNLQRVDRIEIVAEPVVNGGGWYGMDDLTYTVAAAEGAPTVVVDFDDLDYDTKLSGSGYAGLTWEAGSGDFGTDDGVHGPMMPVAPVEEPAGEEGGPRETPRTVPRPPTMVTSYQGVIRGDAGSLSYPPDTDGAVGPNHYVITVNRNFAVYDRETGQEQLNILLGAFLPGSNGDPRVLFDHHSGRWIVLVSDFNATASIYLAVSLTDDPLGDWFKTSFVTAQGSDTGNWPDYPTLGVNDSMIVTTAYMVGGPGHSVFVIDKAPLVASPPSLGTITAFRGLPWERAVQPVHKYDTGGATLLVSTSGNNALHLRRIVPPASSPSLMDLGTISVSHFYDPPDASALGSSTPLDTVDARLMMAVLRGGRLWTAHTISQSGRPACRWYELEPSAFRLVQSGTMADTWLGYFFPSIMVNADGDVVMGFTGSDANQYAGCYVTGRRATDPLGTMAAPVQYKAGTGPQNNIDGNGRNRWGDYSYTTLDPVEQKTFYMLQEYGHAENIWGTYLGVFAFHAAGDMNCDGLVNNFDIAPFVLALTNPEGYAEAYPGCDPLNGDCSGDGLLNNFDIAPFVALLTGG
ncbi:MAG: hypothetical protein PVJ57_16550 [Phycisphaerae bacterium]|jgi:hypothetical protein